MNRYAVRVAGALLLAGGAILSGSACVVSVDAERYTVRDEKRFQVSGTPTLVLDTFDGSVEVRSWDRQEILVEIEKRAGEKAQAEAIEVRADQTGNTVRIEVKQPAFSRAGFGLRVSPSARLVASVPRRCHLNARSGDGGITIERVEGTITLNTGDGGVRGLDLSGNIRAHTGDGSLRFDGIDGTVDLETGDGGVRLAGRLESVRLRTGDGSVVVRAEDGSAMAGDWEIRTGDGGLRLELPDSFAANMDATTTDGSVRVDGFGEPTRPRGDDDRGELRRSLGSGGKLLRLRTGSGAIVVRRL